MLIRLGTIALHSMMGGTAVFCLWYALLGSLTLTLFGGS